MWMYKRVVAWFSLTLSLMLPAVVSADTPTSATDLGVCIDYLGYDEADYRKMLSGRIVSGDLEESSEKELAVSIGMLLPAPLEQVVDLIWSGSALELTRDLLDFNYISDSSPAENSFAGIGLQPDEVGEVSKLLRVGPGLTFNMSKAEIKRFKAIARSFKSRKAERDPRVQEVLNSEYQALLMARYNAYRQEGLKAIAPYYRGSGNHARPDKELFALAAEATLMKDRIPDFYRAFVNYPQYWSDDVENQFLLSKETIQGRPVFILAHRMFRFGQQYAVMTERQFYVGHTYNSQQTIVNSIAVEEGTLLFYQNRTSTDRVAGFASSVRHTIGRKLMRDRIIHHFKALRRSLEQAGSQR
jgi:hypothetical protein